MSGKLLYVHVVYISSDKVIAVTMMSGFLDLSIEVATDPRGVHSSSASVRVFVFVCLCLCVLLCTRSDVSQLIST